MREPDPQPAQTVDVLESAAAGPAAMRGGLVRTAAYAAGLLLGLLSAPLLIRYLGDEEFGRYAVVLAIVAIVSGLSEGGVNTVALRELSIARDRAERDQLMADLLGLRLAFSFVGVALAVGFAAIGGYGGDLALGTLLAGVGMVLAVTQTLLATVLQSRLRFGWAAVIDLLRQLAFTALIVLLVVIGAGLLSFLAVGIPTGLLGLALTLAVIGGTIRLRPAFHPARWMPLLRDTAVFAVAIAVNTVYFRVTLLVMSLVATAAETGDFSISSRVMEVLVGIPALLIGAAFPIVSRTARWDPARFEYATRRLFELGLLLGTLGSLCLVLVAPFVLEVLTGDAHHPATEVLQIQSLALIAGFVASATGFPLLSMRRNRETLIANCASLVVALALAFSLAPSFGAIGAAIAAVTADATLATLNAALLSRRGGPNLPLGALPLAAAAGALGYLTGTLLDVHPVVRALAGAAVFLVVIAAAGRFPPEVRELLRGTGRLDEAR
jgi:O-antigen/teichoic acid export membrane protein